uniref:Amiloride-sensitive sodium channel n=1 Tax=Meloidogyne javanica TaxID=6303 RepID=A0A915N965_MELJA
MVDRTHQVYSIVYSKKFRRWAFYFLIVFLAGMTIYETTNLTAEYLGFPKRADMSMQFNRTIIFPNITFCMSKRQAWSHFGNFGNSSDSGNFSSNSTLTTSNKDWNPEVEQILAKMPNHDSFMNSSGWPQELIMSAYEAIATLNSLEREKIDSQTLADIKAFQSNPKHQGLRTLKWLAAIAERNVSFKDFTQKVGMETLEKSKNYFMRTGFNDSDNFTTLVHISWLSNKQLCFQPLFPNAESFKPIEDQGQFFQMELVHNPSALNDSKQAEECMSLDLHGRPTTMAKHMERKGRSKDGTTEGLCLGRVHETKVEIRGHYIMLENDDEATACRNYDDVDDAEVNEFECRSRCRMKMIRSYCKCTPLTLQYLVADEKEFVKYPACDYEQCQLPDNVTNTNEKTCAKECLPHCVQIRYLVHDTPMGRSPNPAYTDVNLIWGAFEYMNLEQKYVYTIWTFISNIGGSIGVWLVSSNQQPNKKYSTDSARKNEKKLSMNPFGGPVAVNVFESPFPKAQGGGKYPPPSYEPDQQNRQSYH